MIPAPALVAALAAVQFGPGDAAVGSFYAVEPPVTAARSFRELQLERVAPGILAPPAPVAPFESPIPLQVLTGQIWELPERQRLYLAAVDPGGSAHLLELDLIGRRLRQLRPPDSRTRMWGLEMLTTPDGAKLYVQWYGPATLSETDIYDGESHHWLGRTTEFRPDERVAGFEHTAPYVWALDPAGRLVLVDGLADRVVRTVDPERWLGPVAARPADAWRDLVLMRIAAGHDRFRVIDTVSGEVGPPLDLAEYGRQVARLTLNGRFLALIDVHRRPAARRRGGERILATGSGRIYDLRSGERAGSFHLGVPPELPSAALGTTADPAAPGRLWIHTPVDRRRLDLDVAACDRPGAGDRVVASVTVAGDPADPHGYRYTLSVRSGSEAAGGFTLRVDGAVERYAGPAGWGSDRLRGDRWLRWTNGLGPDDEDVGPGESAEFRLIAPSDARPGIIEYRVRARTGLPRDCEPEARFLEQATPGYTIGPERIDGDDAAALARRLDRLVGRACDLGWLEAGACPELEAAAVGVAADPGGSSLSTFRTRLSATRSESMLANTLQEAAADVEAALDRQGR